MPVKICSYNLYGVVNTPSKILTFEKRLELIENKIETLIRHDIDLFFFQQEVNKYNIDTIKNIQGLRRYKWDAICEKYINNEAKDHRPVIITIES